MKEDKKGTNPLTKALLYVVLIALTCIFLGPILFVVMNSFKSKFELSNSPFSIPLGDSFVGLQNYVTGLHLSNFFSSILWSFVITIGSVAIIVMLCAMTAYYITRVKS